jgi:hypothetical protein
LVALVGGLSSVRMDEYKVARSYVRFAESVRQRLKMRACGARRRVGSPPGGLNHLIWAAPGSGKTYVVEHSAGEVRRTY